MRGSNLQICSAGRQLSPRLQRLVGRAAGVLAAAAILTILPSDPHLESTSFGLEFGVGQAQADNGRGGRGDRDRGDRDRGDRDRGDRDRGDRDRGDRDRGDRDRGDRDRGDRDRGDRDRGDQERGDQGRGQGGGRDRAVGSGGVAPADDAGPGQAEPRARAVTAIGSGISERDGEPGTAPTEAGTARTRAMVEIARDMGAATPDRQERRAISGPVTQEMLDDAEQRYVDAVQDAWEAHGFPWNDSKVLDTLGELDSLVTALETIMDGPGGRQRGTQVTTDVNNDGFVDINDLWDAHLQGSTGASGDG